MPKKSNMYLDVDPFKIIETGFHKSRAKVSESIFSLGNEYCGVRGYFEEGYSGDTLIGNYFNGIYEYAKSDTPNSYKGIVKRTHFTINSMNYFKCKIEVQDEALDLNISKFSDFSRTLDMKNGLYTRKFKWITKSGIIEVTFERMLNMINCHEAIQRITFNSNKDINLKLTLSLDSHVYHWGSDCYWDRDNEFKDANYFGVSAKTISTHQAITSMMYIDKEVNEYHFNDYSVDCELNINLKENQPFSVSRYVINIVNKETDENISTLRNQCKGKLDIFSKKGFDYVLDCNTKFFNNVWENSDIEVGGDDVNQQGIRFCIFELAQTYHGYEKDNNIGAKGLTGEAYSGHAFWDSETYCLPYYLFSSQIASKNLLMFRYNTLEEAKARAIDLDCEGACYPIATRNGKEGCNLWQHASLQFQPSTGVFYAITHYMNLYNDKEFLVNYGYEMIIEIAKFLLSRGAYNQDKTKFSFYNVMGPDEFQMMVNHNTYTNYMAKKVFDYLIDAIDNHYQDIKDVLLKCNFTCNHYQKMVDASQKMVILYDKNTKIFEQHDGFFDLPHIDINSIPTTDFPLYSHWSYDRIYRNDMIKQPDVLMFMFLYSQDFTIKEKKANYEYYEPRCIHESSLSPSIHSIFACELGKIEDAYKFFAFATRLDLDDYNCNTHEGIHTTSIAAAWMNIVYGFGGLRSDRDVLVLNPMIIDKWNYYSFKILYQGANIKVTCTNGNKKLVNIKILNNNILNNEIKINIKGKDYLIKDELQLEM